MLKSHRQLQPKNHNKDDHLNGDTFGRPVLASFVAAADKRAG